MGFAGCKLSGGDPSLRKANEAVLSVKHSWTYCLLWIKFCVVGCDKSSLLMIPYTVDMFTYCIQSII